MPRPIVAIVGAPNVGKSALFNRLLGRRQAIVADEPGVTRDRLTAEAEVGARSVTLVDTGGVTTGEKDDLARRVLPVARGGTHHGGTESTEQTEKKNATAGRTNSPRPRSAFFVTPWCGHFLGCWVLMRASSRPK